MLFTETYTELSFYTLSHPDNAYFIHQHIVDAQTAQTADEQTKPIALVFALVGLYLTVEKGYTGKQVQQAHMQLTDYKNQLPFITLPKERGAISAADILLIEPGIERDECIKQWCAEVWNAYGEAQEIIRSFTDKGLIM